MKFTLEMIATALPTLQAAAQREIAPLGPVRIGTEPTGQAAHPDYDDSAWDTIQVGDRWGGRGQTRWLRIPVHVPHAWAQGTVAVRVVLGAYQDISGSEALAYLDGAPVQGFDYYHRELILDRGAGVSSQKAGARKTGSARRSSRW